jgi:hypothetical protein
MKDKRKTGEGAMKGWATRRRNALSVRPLGETSYPCLAIARKHKLDYGDVLLFVDSLIVPFDRQTPHHDRAIDSIQERARNLRDFTADVLAHVPGTGISADMLLRARWL